MKSNFCEILVVVFSALLMMLKRILVHLLHDVKVSAIFNLMVGDKLFAFNVLNVTVYTDNIK